MFMCALSRAYVAPEVVLESLRSFCDSCVLSLFLGRGLAFQDLLSAFCAGLLSLVGPCSVLGALGDGGGDHSFEGNGVRALGFGDSLPRSCISQVQSSRIVQPRGCPSLSGS